MTRFSGAVFCVALGAIALPLATRQANDERALVRALLDRYERSATTGPLVFKSADSLTAALDSVLPAWIAAVPVDERQRRRNVAALLMLDIALADYRSGRAGQSIRPVLLAWGADRLDNGTATEFERTWLLAAYAIAQPAGAAFGNGSRESDQLLAHARRRFPEESRFRLAELLARPVAWVLSNRPGAEEAKLVRSPIARRMAGMGGGAGFTAWPLDQTLKELEALSADPMVGAEATAHAGLIRFHKKDLTRSLEQLRDAGTRAADPFVRNLSWLIAGLNEDAQGRPLQATSHYMQAVLAIPTAKSSAIALAARWFLEGRREQASELLDRALAIDPPTLDPWQHIGDMMRFVPAWMADLHKGVGHPESTLATTAPIPRFTDVGEPPPPTGPEPARAIDTLFTQSTQGQGLPTFRATTTSVLVDVSVRSGRTPVTGLTAEDFVLLDNGVPQRVSDVRIEALPIDLSLVVDFYDVGMWASQTPMAGLKPSYMPDQRRLLQNDLTNIAQLVQPGDRIRMIQVENEPYEVLRLQPAGARLPTEGGDRGFGRISYGRTSSVYDSIAVALMRYTPMGRRHMVLVFTEGADDASVLSKARLLEISKQADAVMHLSKRKTDREIRMERPNVYAMNELVYRDILWPPEPEVVVEVNRLTGGTRLDSLGGSKYDEIRDIIARYRQSYLIRYEPTGVDPSGWHRLQVQLKKPGNYDIQFRSGYWGG